MKNETLALGSLMILGMGYLGVKNKEAIGEAVGRLSVGSGGSPGGVMDLSFIGDIFKAVTDKRETVVKIVKNGAEGGFGISDLKGFLDMGVNRGKGFAGDTYNKVKEKGEDLLGGGFNIGGGSSKRETQSWTDWVRSLVTDNPVSKAVKIIGDTGGESMASIGMILPPYLMGNPERAETQRQKLAKVFPDSLHADFKIKGSGGNSSSSESNGPVQIIKDSAPSSSNVKTGRKPGFSNGKVEAVKEVAQAVVGNWISPIKKIFSWK